MFRRIVLAVGVLGAALVAAGSANAQYSFSGAALITAVSGAGCNSVSAQVHELHTAVYRPAQPGAGVNSAALQVLQHQSALRITPTAGGDFLASGQYSATMFTGRGGLQQFTGNYSRLKIKPNAPTGTTPLLDITGRITNFRNAGNCTIDFAASFVLRPAAP